jgi:two-component system chemotaxis response regulator CheB
LLVKHNYIRLTRGPRENSHRPAADALFRTAATHFGNKVIGVVLSGVLDDGTAGLMAIKQGGGVAVVQDPEDALYPNMPMSALEHVRVDYSLPASELPALLTQLAAERAALPDDRDPRLSVSGTREADMAELEPTVVHDPDRPGIPSGFACPECGGTLFEFQEGELLRFRCRVGHAYSANTLLAEQADGLEAALWAALRALEEQAALAKRLAERATHRGHAGSATNFENQLTDARQHAELIRRVLLTLRPDPSTTHVDPAAPPGSLAS